MLVLLFSPSQLLRNTLINVDKVRDFSYIIGISRFFKKYPPQKKNKQKNHTESTIHNKTKQSKTQTPSLMSSAALKVASCKYSFLQVAKIWLLRNQGTLAAFCMLAIFYSVMF